MTHGHSTIGSTGGRCAGRCARLLVCACLLAAGAAQAQRQGDHGPEQRAPERAAPEQNAQPAPRFDRRIFDSRAFEERRPAPPPDQNARGERRSSGRLTPDERRDLRRQINEAGMDLYPNAQRR